MWKIKLLYQRKKGYILQKILIHFRYNKKWVGSKKIFSSQSSQETKVYYEKSTDTTQNEDEDSKIIISSFEVDETQETNEATQSDEATQSSQDTWRSSWSSLSQKFTSKGEKRERELSDDEEEEPWWESFCS